MRDVGKPAGPSPERPIHDPLTGAYTRTLLPERFAEELVRARRFDAPLALGVLDLDYFKSINDAYGHARGDQVLGELVARLQGYLRQSDSLFRYGGDEFVCLLPGTTAEQARIVAQGCLNIVRSTPFSGDTPLSLSLSMGIAAFPEDGDSLDALFAAADRRHYEAKRHGRGQVVAEDRPAGAPITLPAPTRLIERDAALAIFRQFLDRLAGERRGVFGILGPPGAGRTAFLAAAARMAELRGYAVLPLGAPSPAARVPAEAEGPPELPIAAGPAAVHEALRRYLEQRGGTGLLLTVDNVAALDRPTRSLVRHLLGPASLPILAVAYTRAPGEARDLIAGAVPLREAVELGPLSREGVRVWLRSSLRWEPPADLLDWLYGETRGRPALLQAALTHLLEHRLLEPATVGWMLHPAYATVHLGERLGRFAPTTPHNLPAPLTDLVGRDRDAVQVQTLLDHARLVTLTGAGGIGKTRLALAVAAGLLDEYPGGVWFVSLVAVHDPALVLPTVAATLGVKEVPGVSLATSLAGALRDKPVLLVLDNFEQVVAAAPLVTALLEAAPGLRVLVTSREVLHVYGEHVWAVPPLALPDLTGPASLALLAESPAVALFVAHAQAARFDFTLTAENAPAVVALCTRLEGLPLALELAAAHSTTLSPAQMAHELTSRLALLTGGPADRPARQQTLRGTLDWSYQGLTPAERRLFARLAVFAGGCTLAAAAAVVGDEGSLVALADKSLLNQDAGATGEPRFAMLETIREYALERLTATAQGAGLRRRHATYYLELLRAAEPELLGGPQQGRALQRLEQEHDNLRAALRCTLDEGDSESALALVGILWRFWALRGYLGEGRRWLEEALAPGRGGVPAARAKALQGLGRLALFQGDYDAARAFFAESRALCQALGDRIGLAAALNSLGSVAHYHGDAVQARALIEESLAVYRAADHKPGVAAALGDLALLVEGQGEYDAALRLLEESLALRRALGSKEGVALTLNRLGDLVRAQGESARAAALYAESLALYQELDLPAGTAAALHNLGHALRQQGEPEPAVALFVESLTLLRTLGETQLTVSALAGLAGVLVTLGEVTPAARLFGAVAAALAALGTNLEPADQAEYQRSLDALATRVGPAGWAAAEAAGRRLSLDQALAYALETAAPLVRAPTSASAAPESLADRTR